MQGNNHKSDGLTDNLWADLSLMMALVVILLAIAWQFLYKLALVTFCRGLSNLDLASA